MRASFLSRTAHQTYNGFVPLRVDVEWKQPRRVKPLLYMCTEARLGWIEDADVTGFYGFRPVTGETGRGNPGYIVR